MCPNNQRQSADDMSDGDSDSQLDGQFRSGQLEGHLEGGSPQFTVHMTVRDYELDQYGVSQRHDAALCCYASYSIAAQITHFQELSSPVAQIVNNAM